MSAREVSNNFGLNTNENKNVHENIRCPYLLILQWFFECIHHCYLETIDSSPIKNLNRKDITNISEIARNETIKFACYYHNYLLLTIVSSFPFHQFFYLHFILSSFSHNVPPLGGSRFSPSPSSEHSQIRERHWW